MKTSLTLITLVAAVVVFQTTWALPQPFIFIRPQIGGSLAAEAEGNENSSGGISASQNGNILGDIASGIGGLAQNIAGSIKNATILGIQAKKNFTENVANGAIKLIEGGQQLARIVVDDARELVAESIGNFKAIVSDFLDNLSEQIQDVRNRVKRQVLSEIENQLQQLNAAAESLQEHVGEVREQLQQQVALKEQQELEQWNSWADKLLQAMDTHAGSDQATAQVEGIINDVINRYSSYLSSCADELESQVSEFETEVQDTVEAYEPILKKLSTEVQNCLVSRNTNSAGRQCENAVRYPLSIVHGALLHLGQLKVTGARILAAGYSNRQCVVETLAEFDLEKLEIEIEIANLLEGLKDRISSVFANESDNEEDNESDEDSDEDSESDSESDSASDSDSDNESGSGSDSDSDEEENGGASAESVESGENSDESGAEESDAEESNAEESNAEESNGEDSNVEESNGADSSAEGSAAVEANAEESNVEDSNAEASNAEDGSA